MSTVKKPILSILVITHNQRELLKRCLKSVLEQELSVPFEVIVSDDRSADGTDQMIADCRLHIADCKKQGELPNLVELKYIHCNSNECNPTCTSERCGWNKLNAYNHASGKYFVNIDADDYLLNKDVYQKQIDMLELHPECSMCMQRALTLKEGRPVEEGNAWPKHPMLQDGAVIPKEDFFLQELRGLNQTYMTRRHPEDDMTKLYGKWYDDTVITYHHLQYGPIVFLDRADYVWMQYGTSITHELNTDDRLVTYGLLPLNHAQWIPAFRYWFLREGLAEMIHMLKVAPEYPQLSESYRNYLCQFEGFLFRYFTTDRHRWIDKFHYQLTRIFLLVINKYQLYRDWILQFVYSLL